jgi:hypothetical protein
LRDKVSSMPPLSKPICDKFVEESVNVKLFGITLPQAVGVLHDLSGVVGGWAVRLRLFGHALPAECEIVVAPPLTVVEAHEVAESAQHDLLHRVHRLTSVVVHADPQPVDGSDHHTLSAHHRSPVSGAPPTSD